jgi:hypothetical protein
VGSVPARIRDPAFRLALLAFAVIAIIAAVTEKTRAAAQIAPRSM